MSIAKATISPQAFAETRLKGGNAATPLADGTKATDRLADGIVSKEDYTQIRNDYVQSVMGLSPDEVTGNADLLQQVDEQVTGLISGSLTGEDVHEALQQLTAYDSEAVAVRFALPDGTRSPTELCQLQGWSAQTSQPGQDARYDFDSEVTFGQFEPGGGFPVQVASTSSDDILLAMPWNRPPVDVLSPEYPDIKNAIADAKNRPGSEAIVRNPNGTYSYQEMDLGKMNKQRFQQGQQDPAVAAYVIQRGSGNIVAYPNPIQTPAGYKSVKTQALTEGVEYREYLPVAVKDAVSQDKGRLRTINISPGNLGQLHLQFARFPSGPPFPVSDVVNKPHVVASMVGTFKGGVPAGNIVGDETKDGGKTASPSGFYTASASTGKPIDQRYTFAIKKNPLEAVLFRGGVTAKNHQDYQIAMGGGVLLFDKANQRQMYDAVGTSTYGDFYKNLNESQIIGPGQGGDPGRTEPRGAIAFMPNGSIVLVNVSEGSYHGKGGCTPDTLARRLKEMGAEKAIMFDGGGAPQINARTEQGALVTHAEPDTRPTQGYNLNLTSLYVTTP